MVRRIIFTGKPSMHQNQGDRIYKGLTMMYKGEYQSNFRNMYKPLELYIF